VIYIGYAHEIVGPGGRGSSELCYVKSIGYRRCPQRKVAGSPIQLSRPVSSSSFRTIPAFLSSRTGHVDRSQLKQTVDEAIRRGLIGKRKINRMPPDHVQTSVCDLAERMT
jgi:hypothetical protein